MDWPVYYLLYLDDCSYLHWLPVILVWHFLATSFCFLHFWIAAPLASDGWETVVEPPIAGAGIDAAPPPPSGW